MFIVLKEIVLEWCIVSSTLTFQGRSLHLITVDEGSKATEGITNAIM
jgi:hypothetical protein